MSKYKIATLICSIVTVLVLIGLVVWFLTSGAIGGWRGININIGGGTENLTGPFEQVGSESVSPAGIDRIDIDWTAGEVLVVPHGAAEIIVTEYAQRELSGSEEFHVRVEGNTLRISFTEQTFRTGRQPMKRLQVLVPAELSESLEALLIGTVSAEITVSDIIAERLDAGSTSGAIEVNGAFQRADLSSISGAVRMENTAVNSRLDASTTSGSMNISGSFDRADASSVSGTINLSGTFNRLDAGSTSGAVSVRSETIPELIDISTVSGSVTIYLPDTGEAISVNHSSVSGRLTSDIPHTIGGGRAQIDVSTVSGSTRILALN